MTSEAKLHVAAAIFACLLLPAYSRAAGTGALSWVMFSKSDSFRLGVRAIDRGGAEHLLHPIELGTSADPALRAYLRAADRFTVWPMGEALQAHLPELARNSCASHDYASVAVTLERRASLDAPVRTVHVRVDCGSR